MPLLELDKISVRYSGRRVLQGVGLSVSEREIVTIVGPNGSGKSTLLKVASGSVTPEDGRVQKQPGLKIGYVPQKLRLDRTLPMTVGRFTALPTRHKMQDVRDALHRVGAADLIGRQLVDLSGGQLQRVLLARAILGAPDLLLLDEPTTGLDQAGSAAFYKLLEEIRDDMGCAIVQVSHELHVVMSASDRVICLNGHICCEGTPDVVLRAPEYRALFGTKTQGALALYRHDHDHDHDHGAHTHRHDDKSSLQNAKGAET